MADNYGIIITQPGSTTQGAAASQVALDTSKPFIKLDTQHTNSFLTITLLITTDPPEPPSTGGNTYTTLYKFKHGYSYIPSIETLFYVTSPPPNTTGNQTQTYFMDGGYLINQVDNYAYLYAVADKTYIYYIVHKNNDGSGVANLLTGTNLQITSHVFVEDIGV